MSFPSSLLRYWGIPGTVSTCRLESGLRPGVFPLIFGSGSFPGCAFHPLFGPLLRFCSGLGFLTHWCIPSGVLYPCRILLDLGLSLSLLLRRLRICGFPTEEFFSPLALSFPLAVNL